MMRVLCTLPNASSEIDGVAYEAVEGGMLSAPMEPAAARRLAKIPGFEIAADEEQKVEPRRRGRPPKSKGGEVNEAAAES